MHFRNDHVKYPMITPSLFLITFLLDVYFVLIIEYINFKFLSSCLSCCGMKEKRKRNTFRCCRNGTHYYPFTINYVDDIENDYKQEKDDNEKEDHVSNDIENEITSLLESSKKNNENINVVIVERKMNLQMTKKIILIIVKITIQKSSTKVIVVILLHCLRTTSKIIKLMKVWKV